ncbi:MAG: SPOR domain-containing protein [Methylohalobius sp.]|nr:SPOR domain-containing protein [Methylohalobius sp.]
MVTAKRLALVLLAGNALFFLWAHLRHRPGPEIARNGVVVPVERLVLITELPPPQPEQKEKNADNSSKPEAGTFLTGEGRPACYQIGPFADRKAAEEFASRRRERQVEAEPYLQTVGYWIMYPPAKTLEAARRNLERLKAEGWQDLWLFEHGPWQGAISLGMYTDSKRAEGVVKRLKERGIAAKLMPKQKSITRYWVRLGQEDLEGGKELPVGLKIVPCPLGGETRQ